MDALLVRNSLKMFTAVFITAAIALWFERIEFVWYPLMAVVIVVDDNDDHTVKAATARVMGTVVGGLVTFCRRRQLRPERQPVQHHHERRGLLRLHRHPHPEHQWIRLVLWAERPLVAL